MPHPEIGSAPIAVSAAVLVAGFGVINAFWWLGDWAEGVPGLYDYRSATIGDGVLLPVAAGILVAAGSRLPAVGGERRRMVVAWLLGAATGTVLQGLWLLDPDPEPNWTLPEPHRLNVPGWYHAAFLVVASGVFAALTVRLMGRARAYRSHQSERVEQMVRTPGAAILATCALGFVGLVVADGYAASRDTVSSVAATATVAVGLAVATAMAAWGLGWQAVARGWRWLGVGVLVAVGLATATL